MGISIMSKKSAQDFADDGKILMYEPQGEGISRNLYMVFEKRKRFQPIEKAFIEFCSNYYRDITKDT